MIGLNRILTNMKNSVSSYSNFLDEVIGDTRGNVRTQIIVALIFALFGIASILFGGFYLEGTRLVGAIYFGAICLVFGNMFFSFVFAGSKYRVEILKKVYLTISLIMYAIIFIPYVLWVFAVEKYNLLLIDPRKKYIIIMLVLFMIDIIVALSTFFVGYRLAQVLNTAITDFNVNIINISVFGAVVSALILNRIIIEFIIKKRSVDDAGKRVLRNNLKAIFFGVVLLYAGFTNFIEMPVEIVEIGSSINIALMICIAFDRFVGKLKN